MKHMPLVAAAQLRGGAASLSLEAYDPALDPALEAFKEVLAKPVTALKKRIASDNPQQAQKDIAEKRAVIAKERTNLNKLIAALTASKEKSTHVIDMTKFMGKTSFSANSPATLLTGMARQRRDIEALTARLAAATTKAEVKAVQDAAEANKGKKGSISKEMTFSKDQALGVCKENLAMMDAMDKFLDTAERKAGETLSQEGVLSTAWAIVKGVFIFAVMVIIIVALSELIVMVAMMAWVVHPFLGIAAYVGGIILGRKIVRGTAEGLLTAAYGPDDGSYDEEPKADPLY